tara:strand:+ start:398 stop:700 length:303 start_codon:yes stop_codon:yes gene_type:complete
MNILKRLPLELAQIVNCLAYNRESLREVFRDFNTIRSGILDDIEQVEMHVDIDELDEEEINSIWFPTVSDMLYKLNNKQGNYCHDCGGYKSMEDGLCDCE